MTSLAERLELAMAGPPEVTQAALARACDVKPPSVSDWLNGRTKRLTGTNLLRAAKCLGVRPEWLADGTGPRFPDPEFNDDFFGIREPQTVTYQTTHVHVGGESTPLVYVNRIVGAHLAAGTGEVLYDLDEIAMSRAYDANWMREQGLRPEDCRVWPVKGDSMFPTIPHGSHVLIHLRARQPKHDRVFALIGEDGIRLKRLLQRSDGVWQIHSDNPLKTSYPTEDFIPGKTAILGQCRDVATPMPA